MLKAAGALLVILSCTAMGYGKSLNYSKRLRELEEIQKMVYFLLGEITYRREALPEAMVRVADKVRPPLSQFLREVSKAAKEYQGERFSRIFALKAREYLKDTSLTKGDLEELARLGGDGLPVPVAEIEAENGQQEGDQRRDAHLPADLRIAAVLCHAPPPTGPD